MRLLKNDDRRSAKRAVSKPRKRPVAPPVKAVEQSVLDGLTRATRAIAERDRGANRAPGSARVPTYLPVEDSAPAGEGGSGSDETARGRAGLGAVTPDSESEAFAVHLGAEPTLERPIAPVPGTPDPWLERARIERELGIDAISSSLEEYGTPPVA